MVRITLVYGAKDARHNNAVVLMELLEELRIEEGRKQWRSSKGSTITWGYLEEGPEVCRVEIGKREI